MLNITLSNRKKQQRKEIRLWRKFNKNNECKICGKNLKGSLHKTICNDCYNSNLDNYCIICGRKILNNLEFQLCDECKKE